MPASSCKEPECHLPKLRPYHRCYWHQAMTRPSHDQVELAEKRLGLVPQEIRLRVVHKSLWPASWRFCAGCQSMIPNFYARGSQCRACASAKSHAAMVQKTYGIDADRYAELLKIQDNRCAICRARAKGKRFAVDHQHGLEGAESVRGLLCKSCNKGILGSAHDSVRMLQAAAHYLMHPPATGQWWPPEDGLEVEVTRTLQESDKAPKTLKDYGLMAVGQEKVPPGPEDGGKQSNRNPWGKRTIVLPAGAVSDPDRKGYWKLYVEVGVDGKVGPALF